MKLFSLLLIASVCIFNVANADDKRPQKTKASKGKPDLNFNKYKGSSQAKEFGYDKLTELMDNTFDEFVKKTDSMAVLFIDDSNTQKMTTQLKELGIANMDIEKKMKGTFPVTYALKSKCRTILKNKKVTEFPTLVVYHNQKSSRREVEPNQLLQSRDIRIYIRSISDKEKYDKFAPILVQSVSELKNNLNKFHGIVVYLGKSESPKFQTFKKAMQRLKDFKGYYIFDDQLKNQVVQNNKEQIVYMTSFEEYQHEKDGSSFRKQKYKGNFTMNNIVTWVQENQLGNVFKLNKKTYKYITKHKAPFFMFIFTSDKDKKNYFANYVEFGKAMNFEISFGFSIIPDEWSNRFLNDVGVDKKSAPAVLLIDNFNGKRRVYQLKADKKTMKRSALKSFYNEYKSGKAKAISLGGRSSALARETPMGRLRELTTTNHDQLVNNTRYDSVVIYVTDDCKNCKRTLELYQGISDELQNNNKLRFFWMNLSKHTVENVKSYSLAQVKLFSLGKRKKPVNMSSEKSSTRIKQKIKSNVSFDWIKPAYVQSRKKQEL